MIWLIIFTIISAFITIFTLKPIVCKYLIFKRGYLVTGSVVDMTLFKSINSKEKYRISIKYDVNDHMYSQSFKLNKKECTLKIGDSVALLYDLKNPKRSHISVDSDSCFFHFQKFLMTMTVIALLTIGLRSILLYINVDNYHSLLSIFPLAMVAVIFLAILSIHITIYTRISKLRNVINGEVIEKINNKDIITYKVKYNVKNCIFTFLYNSKEDIELGTIVKISYLESLPFIACIANKSIHAQI